MAAKTWFSARLLFVSEIPGEPQRDRLCEESIIVVQESDEAGARQTAQELGLSMQHSYPNEQGELVEWQFLRVLEVQDLCVEQIESGTEVFSHLFRESQATDPEISHSLNSKRSVVPE